MPTAAVCFRSRARATNPDRVSPAFGKSQRNDRGAELSTTSLAGEPPRVVSAVARIYAHGLLIGFALLPSYLIAYLWFFGDPRLTF